jgi:hypothetical protein
LLNNTRYGEASSLIDGDDTGVRGHPDPTASGGI